MKMGESWLYLGDYLTRYPARTRDNAKAHVYLSGAYPMAKMGQCFEVYYTTVSRAVRKYEVN